MGEDKTVVLGDKLDAGGRDSISIRPENLELERGAMLASRYQIKAKIGEGGMGLVYEGVDTQLSRPVAIKLLKRNFSENEKEVQNLKAEAQVSMILTHPGIMRLINFEQHGQYAFLLMEYVDGMDLKTIAKKKGGRLDAKTVAHIAFQLCTALEYAHKNNVIHRDIKPANVMINSKKEVKLMDFGIAKVLMSGSKERPALAGTLAYLAPELIQGKKPDARCDIYALGLTMYELLAGVHPCKGMKAQQVIKAHLNMAFPPIEGVDESLFNIISQCIEKRPNARFQSAEELKGALGKYLGLDESHKVSRMKASMEHEKRKLEIEQRKVQEKLKSLENEIKRVESRPVGLTDDAGPGFSLFGFSKEGVKVQFPLVLGVVAAFAGVAAAIVGEKVKSGDLFDAGSFEANAMLSVAAMGAIALMPPSVYKYGASEWFRTAAMGAVGGLASYYLWIQNFNDGATLGLYSHYLVFGLAMAVGVILAEPESGNFSRVMEVGPIVLIALAASSITALLNLGTAFGFSIDMENLFYLPIMLIALWVALDIRDQRS